MEIQKKSLGSQIGWLSIGNLINALVNILLLPYLARALSVELYGTYGQVLMLMGIVNVCFAFGLSNLVLQYLNKHTVNIGNIFWTAFGLGVFGSILLYLAAPFVAAFFENQMIEELLRIYSFSLAFIFVTEILKSILNHHYQSEKVALITIVHNCLRVGLIFFAIHFFESIKLLFYFLFFVEIGQFILAFVVSPTRQLFGKLKWKVIKEVLFKGFPLSLSGAASILLVQTDGVMISRMLGTEDYAIFRMGAVPIPFLFIVFASVIKMTQVEVNKHYAANELSKLIQIKRKASSAIAFVTYPPLIFFLIFSAPFIEYYLGDTYAASSTVFVIYNLLLFLRVNDYRDVLIAASKTKEIFMIDLSILSLNVVLNYFLIKAFGINGAAVASICSYYLLSASLQWRTMKKLASPFFSIFNLSKLIKMILVCTLLAFAIYRLYLLIPTIYSFIVASLIYIPLSYWLLLKTSILDYKLVMKYTSDIKVLKPLRFILSKIK